MSDTITNRGDYDYIDDDFLPILDIDFDNSDVIQIAWNSWYNNDEDWPIPI